MKFFGFVDVERQEGLESLTDADLRLEDPPSIMIQNQGVDLINTLKSRHKVHKGRADRLGLASESIS